MSLSVLSIAFPFARVSPSTPGGAEQMVSMLDHALCMRGHHSTVVAQHGSEVSGDLFTTPAPSSPLTDHARSDITAKHQQSIDRALRSRSFDIIHMHGIDFSQYHIPPDIPVLVTLHLPPSWYPATVWHHSPNVHLQCVSTSQRRACQEFTGQELTVIVNAAPTVPDALPAQRGDFALMLGRICPEKNFHTGLDAAKLAGVPARIAGETFPYPDHLRYLHEEIEPRLGPSAVLQRPVGGQGKMDLLRTARCLLLPTIAPETSSLVAMEALHAGTPVIAFPSGAIPEIICDGVTGFLVNSPQEMADAILRSSEINPDLCRSVARERFSLSRMLDEYFACYASLVAGSSAPASPISDVSVPHEQPPASGEAS